MIKSGKDMGMTISECIDAMRRQGIPQYRRAGNQIYLLGYFQRGRNYRPQEGRAGHIDIYYRRGRTQASRPQDGGGNKPCR